MAGATVFSINISRGGVPKRPAPSAWVGIDGVEGDGQRNRQLHGGADRAVSLYSLDLIQALQAEGHPLEPGSLAENLTLSGIDWSLMVPGAQLEVGPVLLELTSYVHPCKNVRASFINGEFTRVSQKLRPGWSRLYARVLEEGTITPGMSCGLRPRACGFQL
jgi:MOSC domain-containing protein YiiM